MESFEINEEMRRVQAEFRQLVATAGPEELDRPSNGTRWTNRQLLFHMVLGYGVVRTLLPLVRTLGRLGHSRGFAATLHAVRSPFHWINYIGPCVASRVPSVRAMTVVLDWIIQRLDRCLAAETKQTLALSLCQPDHALAIMRV